MFKFLLRDVAIVGVRLRVCVCVLSEMICILLVAGHASGLEAELKSDPRGIYAHLEGVPKVTKHYFVQQVLYLH